MTQEQNRDARCAIWNAEQLERLTLLGLRLSNPYTHPKHRGVSPQHVRECAQKYFGWMLLNGAKIEALKLDPYWKYMEDEDA